jgi:hypothetical protein
MCPSLRWLLPRHAPVTAVAGPGAAEGDFGRTRLPAIP